MAAQARVHFGHFALQGKGPFRRFLTSVVVLVLCFEITACIYVPQTKVVDEPGGHSILRWMLLEERIIFKLQNCSDNGCVAVLVGTGIVSAASAVKSGSIAVVGNVVYWAERERTCLRNQTINS